MTWLNAGLLSLARLTRSVTTGLWWLPLMITGVSATAVEKPESTAATHRSAEQSSDQSHAALSNTLKWQTAMEFRNFGYDIYRAIREEGPFEKINSEIVLGNGTSDIAHQYQYVDRQAAPCVAYFYYIESITVDGERKPFTPTISAAVKGVDGAKFETVSACEQAR